MSTLQLIGKEDCWLCEQAKDLLFRADIEFEEISILGDFPCANATRCASQFYAANKPRPNSTGPLTQQKCARFLRRRAEVASVRMVEQLISWLKTKRFEPASRTKIPAIE